MRPASAWLVFFILSREITGCQVLSLGAGKPGACQGPPGGLGAVWQVEGALDRSWESGLSSLIRSRVPGPGKTQAGVRSAGSAAHGPGSPKLQDIW